MFIKQWNPRIRTVRGWLHLLVRPGVAAAQVLSKIQLIHRDSLTMVHPLARPHFTHQSFFEYASQSALHCPWAKAFIKEQLERGKTHPTAVRALAFKWQRIMFICW